MLRPCKRLRLSNRVLQSVAAMKLMWLLGVELPDDDDEEDDDYIYRQARTRALEW